MQTLNLAQGIANSVDAKLQTALEALDAANAGATQSACNRMTAFLNQVRAQAGKAITQSQADQLAALAQQTRAALACR